METATRVVTVDHAVDSPAPVDSGRRFVALDGLRAVAVGLVLLDHGFGIMRSRTDLFRWWAPGPAGVRLFFVLSGFLITGILLDARSEASRRAVPLTRVWLAFYARRALRIFPVAYVALIVAWIIGIVSVRNDWPWYFSYLSNVLSLSHADGTESAGHYWSLAVEEQFYLVWPLLMLWLPRRWLVPVMAMSIVGAGLTRWMLISHGSWMGAYELTPARLDSLAAGGLFASIREALRPRATILAGVGVLVVVLGVMIPASSRSSVVVEWGGVVLALALIQAARSARAATRVLSWPPLVYIGTISYAIYIVHQFIPETITIIERHLDVSLHFPPQGLVRFMLISGISIVVASASWRFLESPVNALKRYVPYLPPDSTRAPSDLMPAA
jgi:peptidoglycan/LPS O-acetylase OafA/YrhL